MSDNNVVEANKTDSRRKFLQRAGTGVIIASLPMKSVWANGITNSIVASGHGSDWAAGNQITLKSHGYWKNHINNISEKNDVFDDIFGTPLIGHHAYTTRPILRENGNVFPLRLKHLIRGEGNSGVWLSNTRKESSDGATHPAWLEERTRKNNLGEDVVQNQYALSGPDNVNCHLVAMYLNALYHGHFGIDYPVANAFPDGLTGYVNYLKNEYTTNPSNLGVQLSDIISKCADKYCDGSDFA